MGTGFRVSQGMVVGGQVIAAGGRHGLQLAVRQSASVMLTGSCEGVVKLIVRIVHLIYPEHLFQASLVEGAIVGNKI